MSSDRLQLANLLSFERNLGRTDFAASADEYDVMELGVTVLNQLRWLTELGLMDQTDSVARASVAFRPALVEACNNWIHRLTSPWRSVRCRSWTRYPGNSLRILVDHVLSPLVASIAEVSGDRGRHVAVMWP